MLHAFFIGGIAFLSLLAGTSKAGPQNPLTLKVYPTVSFQPPALIRLTTRVEPHEDNRSICVFIGGDGNYEASSCKDIGAIPITYEWKWWVPAGEYEGVAVLTTISGVIRTAVKFKVVGHDDTVPDAFDTQ
jgi:hypothetical protein